MKINAFDRTIREIFSSNHKYVVPRFQRPYSWGDDEINEFWGDVTSNIRSTSDGYKLNEYFIGSLVLVGTESSNSLQIVDGQQRLTTITVFFSALIDIFKELNQDHLAKGLYQYIEGNDISFKPFFKLENENPKPFFQKSIQNFTKEFEEITTEEEDRLNKAFIFYKNKLDSLKAQFSDEKYLEYIQLIRDQILNLKTIYITVDNMDDAYTIFETLNSKGIDLSKIDLIKNFIFKVLNHEHPSDDAKDNWNKILANLAERENIEITTFFRHYWLSKYEFVREAKLYKSFKNHISPEKNEVREFLNSLVKESKRYQIISSPQLTDWRTLEERDIYDSLNALNIFKVTQVKMIILALFHNEMKTRFILKIL